MEIIAKIYNDFPTKFAVPRQSGLVDAPSTIVFEKEYRVKEALRGLEGYSHIWLLWSFHDLKRQGWEPTVRPPRLGGNTRMGVFATRSPYRPNPIGLSCVRLLGMSEEGELGTVLHVSGADLMNETPILDIKPYLPYTDAHPEAEAGFAGQVRDYALRVHFPEGLLEKVPEDKRDILTELLSQDPRPGYQRDPDRVYGFSYAGMEVRFQVDGQDLTVTDIQKTGETHAGV
ncbi:MAG: tRNA (N6-threonylcarbamoyladenosine(37)-N6)-methyltransferase TrmO [Clostridia bacterium]|jgi:tRNA-Thr(GGU) m(6)t(6)A37 methyltransferase TsaA|nr:tRNA (N6-threonylcarbamoyladenosine(37)-N6)-methyltransferase TrmO [Clostridia bacterium]